MWETTFQHTSSTPLPPNISIDTGLELLHDFDFVVRLSPDCRGCRPIPPPQPKNLDPKTLNNEPETVKYYEVEDDLPFIPKTLWSGSVKYRADFVPTQNGCAITVHAPGGFTSTNHWRLLRDNSSREGTRSKDSDHVGDSGAGWYVQIVSDAKVEKMFAGFVKGFLKNSHRQLQAAFVERLKDTPAQQRCRRPTLGRRRSSVL
ncbi:uncharacterized protein MYCFIDRAFT_210196 [Pseudocercospora fijiensis CIRAD86]|uniref:DUF7053 domain-containing protein n=1 Tax=Pseudocercospora fijiensis (strain CIRAD86) TaxID=383855 RepID=M2Z6B7_PSEFD|nr:uncharacterized protein MYCFIDRAFT_210196 [Pseudocercospora fijiensis CIRAD86]EME85305.1 hypothetical protein MYCFIDRAFT_210196 [Pseudocercospora fijiensis CIRAD86]